MSFPQNGNPNLIESHIGFLKINISHYDVIINIATEKTSSPPFYDYKVAEDCEDFLKGYKINDIRIFGNCSNKSSYEYT